MAKHKCSKINEKEAKNKNTSFDPDCHLPLGECFRLRGCPVDGGCCHVPDCLVDGGYCRGPDCPAAGGYCRGPDCPAL